MNFINQLRDLQRNCQSRSGALTYNGPYRGIFTGSSVLIPQFIDFYSIQSMGFGKELNQGSPPKQRQCKKRKHSADVDSEDDVTISIVKPVAADQNKMNSEENVSTPEKYVARPSVIPYAPACKTFKNHGTGLAEISLKDSKQVSDNFALPEVDISEDARKKNSKKLKETDKVAVSIPYVIDITSDDEEKTEKSPKKNLKGLPSSNKNVIFIDISENVCEQETSKVSKNSMDLPESGEFTKSMPTISVSSRSVPRQVIQLVSVRISKELLESGIVDQPVPTEEKIVINVPVDESRKVSEKNSIKSLKYFDLDTVDPLDFQSCKKFAIQRQIIHNIKAPVKIPEIVFDEPNRESSKLNKKLKINFLKLIENLNPIESGEESIENDLENVKNYSDVSYMKAHKSSRNSSNSETDDDCAIVIDSQLETIKKCEPPSYKSLRLTLVEAFCLMFTNGWLSISLYQSQMNCFLPLRATNPEDQNSAHSTTLPDDTSDDIIILEPEDPNEKQVNRLEESGNSKMDPPGARQKNPSSQPNSSGLQNLPSFASAFGLKLQENGEIFLSPETAWQVFSSTDDMFPSHYAIYHHFRSLNFLILCKYDARFEGFMLFHYRGPISNEYRKETYYYVKVVPDKNPNKHLQIITASELAKKIQMDVIVCWVNWTEADKTLKSLPHARVEKRIIKANPLQVPDENNSSSDEDEHI